MHSRWQKPITHKTRMTNIFGHYIFLTTNFLDFRKIFTMWDCKFHTVSETNGSTAPASDGDSHGSHAMLVVIPNEETRGGSN